MIRLAVLITALLHTIAVQAETPLMKLLKSAPEVHSVERHFAGVPSEDPERGRTIIVHIRDWHWVPLEYVAAELPANTDRRTVRAHYDRFLKSVKTVQDEQYVLLKRLADAGYRTVYREALTPDVEPLFRALCRTLWSGREAIPDVGPELLKMPNILAVGAPGRLLAEGTLKRVRALDTDESLKLTRPLDEDGRVRKVTEIAREKREDHMIRTVLKAKGVALVVLGGAHDLTDNVRELATGKTTLIVVTTKQYAQASREKKR